MDAGFLEKECLMHLCGAGGNGSCAIYLSAALLLQPPLWGKGSKSTMIYLHYFKTLMSSNNMQEHTTTGCFSFALYGVTKAT